ncbi:cation transporter dimerization domain-containing protein [Micromonospora sp. PLK6-60]|uniref:cation transporter dimerization domain-containing protein n=1 Tax=Micromonospora sp. PLK6-60 TaxID=2873383 RepID=UPI0021075B2C|nr:cation transporter dimerization domain-containing protein [Micromonospora sp. PLK6-60]
MTGARRPLRRRHGHLAYRIRVGRQIGHRLHAEADLVVDANRTLIVAHEIAAAAEHQMTHAVPRLTTATVHTDPHSHPGAENCHSALTGMARSLSPNGSVAVPV